MHPMVRYVLHTVIANGLCDNLRACNINFTQSCFNSYERRYAAQNANGRRIVLTRSNAFGDTLIATSIPRYIKHIYPEARVDVYAPMNVATLWTGCGATTYALPLIFEAAIGYDWHILFEGMFENDGEPEQRNCYDNHFGFLGFNPNDIPADFKRPFVHPLQSDWKEIEELKLSLLGKYIVIQASAANPNRTYPQGLAVGAIHGLLKAYPDHRIMLVGTDKSAASAIFTTIKSDRLVNLINQTKQFRSLVPIIMNASLVICPDSSVGHLAAGFPNVPVISLWGLFHPDDRAKYYRNHHPLFVKDECPHAPCRNHQFQLPQAFCKDAKNATPGEQPFCNAMRAITPEMIVETALSLVK